MMQLAVLYNMHGPTVPLIQIIRIRKKNLHSAQRERTEGFLLSFKPKKSI
jgi:hypothetical protein